MPVDIASNATVRAFAYSKLGQFGFSGHRRLYILQTAEPHQEI